MFEYYNNNLCVQANWLADVGIATLDSLRQMFVRRKIKRAKEGKGAGNYTLYIYSSLPERFKNIIEHDMKINPYQESSVISFSDYLEFDETASAYFEDYELEDGRCLSEANEEAVLEYTANSAVLNAVHKVLHKVTAANPKINKAELWERIAKSVKNISGDLRKCYPFDLPANPRALRAKYEACILARANNRYPRVGLEGLIHDNYCNKHTIKITEEVGRMLIAYYALPVKYSIPELLDIYEKDRAKTGFPRLSESAIYNYLMKPEIMRIWMVARDGKDEYNKVFGHTIKRNRETLFPNAHWAIDGTKLDAVHYMDNNSKMAAMMNIDVVIDVHSEKILGWSFSETENHVDHFKAVRMAVNTSGVKPYLFTYDAQSGHRTKKMQELYGRLSKTHYHHKVGRKSNPIEQVFDRFQQQVINKRWFSDKQSIKSHRSNSKVNMDFIREFKQALPTKEELYKHFIIMVEEWNNMDHPRLKKPRNEVYETQTEYRQELDPFEQISLFWLTETKPKKYYAHGMPLTVAGVDYEFEVYDENNEIDQEFRRKYVNSKLVVCYDPEYLNEYVKLYEVNEKGQKVFVTYAQKKRQHTQIPMLHTKESKAQLLRDMQIKDKEFMRDWESYQKIAELTGITREKLIDDQNAMVNENWEFEAKSAAYSTKTEQLKTNKKTLLNQLNPN